MVVLAAAGVEADGDGGNDGASDNDGAGIGKAVGLAVVAGGGG